MCVRTLAEWDAYFNLVKSGSTGVTMNPAVATWIVDRHNAWEKRSLDKEVEHEDDLGSKWLARACVCMSLCLSEQSMKERAGGLRGGIREAACS